MARYAAVAWLAAFALPACERPLSVADDAKLRDAVAALDAGDAVVLVAVGDVARCKHLAPAAATARLARSIVAAHAEARVITLGDHTYPDGTREELAECYEPTWGALNAVTAPSPGNHDYETDDGAPHYEYFAHYQSDRAARERGYYSFEAGGWHVLSLNSNIEMDPGSEQVRWLEASLAAADARCVLAYWHHPLFSSGFHGLQRRDPGRATRAFWDVLARFGADVVVNGHTHMYERFARQTPDGEPAADGITEIVVGTGGASLDAVLRRKANSAFVNNDVYGVLVLMLRDASYEWAFVSVDGTIHDRSTAPTAC